MSFIKPRPPAKTPLSSRPLEKPLTLGDFNSNATPKLLTTPRPGLQEEP